MLISVFPNPKSGRSTFTFPGAEGYSRTGPPLFVLNPFRRHKYSKVLVLSLCDKLLFKISISTVEVPTSKYICRTSKDNRKTF